MHDESICRVISRLDTAHWIPHAHQNEQQRLLERSYPAQVDRRQPTDGHCADAVEERVGVRHPVLPIARIEDTGHDQRGKGAVDGASQHSLPEAKMGKRYSPTLTRIGDGCGKS